MAKEETVEENNWFLGLTALAAGSLGKPPENTELLNLQGLFRR